MKDVSGAAAADETLPRTGLPVGSPAAAARVGRSPERPAPLPDPWRETPDIAARPASGATWDDLDPREFDRLRRLVGAASGRGDTTLAAMSDEQIARSLGVLLVDGSHRHLLTGALLLFGRPEAVRRHVPNHEAAIQVLGPETGEPTTGMNDFFRWPLLHLTEELLARFRARNPEREIRYELVRTGVPTVAEQAFRELLANAFVHRDYTATGAVHVQWTAEGIEISSPGGFADGMHDPGARLPARPPRPRSPLLADAFRRAGITDRSGRGIRRAHAAQLRNGLGAPTHVRSTADSVVAVLPGEPADLAFALFAVGRESAGRPLALPDLLVLRTALDGRRLRTVDVAELLGTDKNQARRVLTGMLREGLLEVGGDGGARTWSPSTGVRRALRDSASQVHAQLAEPGRPGGRGGQHREYAGARPSRRGDHPGARGQAAVPAQDAAVASGPPGWAIPGGPALLSRRALDG